MNYTYKINKQAKVFEGIKFIDLKGDLSTLTFCTLTAWESESDLRQFMLSGYHKKALKITKQIARVAISTHFESERIPDWQEALQRLNQIKKVYE